MPRPSSRFPTDLELEMLKILWRDGPLSVGEIRDALAPNRDLAYTSVLTVLGIMTRKGYVVRTQKGRAHIYQAKLKEKSTKGGMLRDLVDRAFSGSTSAAMVNLLESEDLDKDELEKIRLLIETKAEEEGEK